MHSITLWKLARPPNYNTNIDKVYPYSEVPFLGDYNLVKLPLSLNNLIDHVDYWGEGRIQSQHGISGFANCYNVNHTYQLVSNGPDRDRKIPNRIPVLSYTNCDTSAYIKDNSVVLVTLMGAPINLSCAADIARMVNNDLGKVIVYGFTTNSQGITNLASELRNKSLYLCPGYKLPEGLDGLTLFDEHLAFLNITMIKNELYKLVTNGLYDDAVTLAKNLQQHTNEEDGDVLREVVQKLLTADSTTNIKVMTFAYKLWINNGKDIVRNYFPEPFKLIFGQENVTIVNKGYLQALKLDANLDSYNDRLAWGDSQDKTSKRVSWRFIPVLVNNIVTFKLYNVDCNMYLKLDANTDGAGDRKAWGSFNYDEDRHRYYVEPLVKDGTIEFFIVNYQYRQGLKLAVGVDSYGDRLLWGHNGDIYSGEGRFKWIISAW